MWLAVREIRRSVARFGLLSGAVGLLIFLIFFQLGLLNGLITSFVGAIENQNAPVLVYSEDARRNVEGSIITPDAQAAVAGVDGIAQIGPVGEGTFTVIAGGRDQDAVLFGYELGGLGAPTTLAEGRLPQGPNEAVASSADAAKGFDIGDVVDVVGDGGPKITVVGLADDLRWSVTTSMFVSYRTFEDARRAAEPFSEIVLPSLLAVSPTAGVPADELAERITSSVDGVEALERSRAAAETPGVEAINQSFAIVLALVFVVVALVVGFFFLILTVQKSKPLVLLRAIGAPPRYLVAGLAAQIVSVLAIGSAIGIGLYSLVTSANLSGDVEPDVSLRSIVTTLAILAVVSIAGGGVSVRRLLRIEPIRAAQPGATL